MSNTPSQFVSRAGLKLDHALREFNIDVTGLTCADFGCNIGGFTDCLLQRGAAKVYAIDTGYGTLAWKLRNDPRVIVMERTNALHAPPPPPLPIPPAPAPTSPVVGDVVGERGQAKPQAAGGADLVVIDLAWTPQRLAIPAALKWLKPSGGGRIITLVKPHYELSEDEKKSLLVEGRLDPTEADRILQRTLSLMPEWGVQPLAHVLSPITGGKSSKGKVGTGNVEFLVHAARPR